MTAALGRVLGIGASGAGTCPILPVVVATKPGIVRQV